MVRSWVRFRPTGRQWSRNAGYSSAWDLTTGKAVFESVMGEGLGSPTQHVAFTPDGKELFASGGSNSARWSLATRKAGRLAPGAVRQPTRDDTGRTEVRRGG